MRRLASFQGALPEQVLHLVTWLPWMPFPRSNGRIGKPPCLPRHGSLRPVDCRGAGLPLEEAYVLARRYNAGGLGVVLSPDHKLAALDLDLPLGAQARRLLTLPGYAERSPGGGIHLWCSGALAGNRRQPELEVLVAGYVTVTGAALPARGRALGDLTQIQETLGVQDSRPDDFSVQLGPAVGLSDQELLYRLRRARNGDRVIRLLETGDWQGMGYASASEADLAAVRQVRFYSQDPVQLTQLLRASALRREKWGRGDYLARTVARGLAMGGPVWTQGGRA